MQYKEKYELIYADPSWKFKNKNTGGNMNSGAANKYSVMTIDDICDLPVSEISADNCLLAMWWVASMPKEALRVVEAWGFTLKTMTGFTWKKLTKTGRPWFGMGFWTRQGSENVIFAIKGKPKRISASIRSVIDAKVREHSEKPDIFRTELVNLMGYVPRVELFARKSFTGWDAIGNEIDGRDIRDVLQEIINKKKNVC